MVVVPRLDSLTCLPVMVSSFSLLPEIDAFLMFLPLIFFAAIAVPPIARKTAITDITLAKVMFFRMRRATLPPFEIDPPSV